MTTETEERPVGAMPDTASLFPPAAASYGSPTSSGDPEASDQTASTEPARTPMTDEHKEALAKGRAASQHVKAYLELLQEIKPARGRRRNKERIETLLTEARARQEAGTENPLQRLLTIQEIIDLEKELKRTDTSGRLEELESLFVQHVPHFAISNGISFQAFRELKAPVPVEVLNKAGITASNSHLKNRK